MRLYGSKKGGMHTKTATKAKAEASAADNSKKKHTTTASVREEPKPVRKAPDTSAAKIDTAAKRAPAAPLKEEAKMPAPKAEVKPQVTPKAEVKSQAAPKAEVKPQPAPEKAAPKADSVPVETKTAAEAAPAKEIRRIDSKQKHNHFLLAELIERDFIKKYKRTTFGILWSALSPLLLLLTMAMVFGAFFGRNTPHYTIYLFCGLLLFNYFSKTTTSAMRVLSENAAIYSKVPVPKTYFLISHSVAQFIDFLVSLLVFLIFVYVDGIAFRWNFLMALYPIICLYLINFGIGMFLSTLYIFFRDISYLYPVITRVIMYASAIFYDVSILPSVLRRLLNCNPLYMCVNYFRQLIIHSTVPSISYHLMLAGMAVFCLVLGGVTYRMCRDKIALYV